MNETSSQQFGNQLRDLWRTRPTRIEADSKVAGVSAGIGYRYGVDPQLIRVAFIVSTVVGGAGIALYLACWVALPSDGGASAPGSGPGEGAPATANPDTLSPLRLVALTVLLLAALTATPIDRNVGGAGFLSAVLMLGGLWLLYRRQPLPPGIRPPTSQEPDAQDSEVGGAQATAAMLDWSPESQQIFPAVDATDHDSASSAPASGGSPHSRLTAVFLGLALLSVASATAIAIAGGVEWLTPSRIAAVALAVIGIGLVTGAFLHTGSGLLIAAVPVAGIVILASLVAPINISGGIGNGDFRPATTADLHIEYQIGIGELRLDLRNIELDQDHTLSAVAGIGRVEVIVPDGMHIRVSCETGIGSTDCLPDQEASGGPLLTINARSTIGEVVVGRG